MRCSCRSDEGISTNDKRNLKSPAIEQPQNLTDCSRSNRRTLQRWTCFEPYQTPSTSTTKPMATSTSMWCNSASSPSSGSCGQQNISRANNFKDYCTASTTQLVLVQRKKRAPLAARRVKNKRSSLRVAKP